VGLLQKVDTKSLYSYHCLHCATYNGHGRRKTKHCCRPLVYWNEIYLWPRSGV